MNQLQSELGLVDTLLQNLNAYCKAVRAAQIEATSDPRKVFVASKTYSHSEEVAERLQFLKFYASVCDY